MNLRELPPVSRPGQHGPPRSLRAVGLVSLVVVLVSILTVDPRPGLSGDGPIVALGLVLMVVGIAGSLRRSHLPGSVRLVALLMAASRHIAARALSWSLRWSSHPRALSRRGRIPTRAFVRGREARTRRSCSS